MAHCDAILIRKERNVFNIYLVIKSALSIKPNATADNIYDAILKAEEYSPKFGYRFDNLKKPNTVEVPKPELVELKKNVMGLLELRDELQKAIELHELFKITKRVEQMTFDKNKLLNFTSDIMDINKKLDHLLK